MPEQAQVAGVQCQAAATVTRSTCKFSSVTPSRCKLIASVSCCIDVRRHSYARDLVLIQSAGHYPRTSSVVAEIAFSGPLVKPASELSADLYRQKIL